MKCSSPIYKKSADGAFSFPCGKCAACIQRRTNDLFVRANIEYQKNNYQGYFVTLTYNNENLKLEPSKSDVQKFFKRLRIFFERKTLHKKLNLKYMLVSELGSQTQRLHYHFLLFGVPRYVKTKKQSIPLNFVLSEIWGMGFVDVSPMRSARAISYTIKYVSKDKIQILFSDYYKNQSAKNIFLLSKNFGALSDAQKKHLTKKITNLHNMQKTGYVSKNMSDYTIQMAGRNFAIPRYHKLQLSVWTQQIATALFKKYVETQPDDLTYTQYEKLSKKLFMMRSKK